MIATSLMCSRCICTSGMVGVTFNENGICSECADYDKRMKYFSEKNRYEERMNECFRTHKRSGKKGPYDVLVAFSGGKDSTYLLYLMKEKYNLNPLAFAVIHPFVSQVAVNNMDTAAKLLNVDMLKFYPAKEIHRKILRAAIAAGRKNGLDEIAGCQACSGIYDSIALKTAIREKIPFIVSGNDPSQEAFPQLIESEELREKCLNGILYGSLQRLFNNEMDNKYRGSIYDFSFDNYQDDVFPTKIAPFSLMNYNPEACRSELERAGILQNLNLDPEATNCDLFHFFSYISYKEYGCHAYARIISEGIRSGRPTPIEQFAGSPVPLGRDIHAAVLDEYRSALFNIADNPYYTIDCIKENMSGSYPLLYLGMGEEKLIAFFSKMANIHKYIRYFDLV